ncbi:MAG: helix-turn-helix domain-containing protein [Nitrososphaeraceae archaeon]
MKQKSNLKYEIVKSIAALLNSRGGILVIGYDKTNQQIVGVDIDYQLLKENQNWDGWQLAFRQLLLNNFKRNQEIISRLRVIPILKESKTIVKVEVPASDGQVFVGENDDFYIRYLNSTEKLLPKQIIEYSKIRWKDI